MLQSSSKHQHTSDPTNTEMYPWKDISSGTVDGLGGSASSTPSAANPADRRDRLSMWGSTLTTNVGGCCSERITESRTGYSIPFSVYYQVPPAEPPTARIPLVVVRHDSQAGAAFWKHECARISDNATNLVVSAGDVTDLFRPVPGATFCEMRTAGDKHLWSADGHVWYQPLYDLQNTAWYGGSAIGWLQTVSPRDQRQHLSVWGSNNTTAEYSGGGCCSSSYASADINPNQAFAIAFTHRYTDLLVIDVASDKRANAAFWGDQCKQVPEDAASVRMDCGAVTDYFRPVDDVSWCAMLTSYENHEWSPSGEVGSWKRPSYAGSHLGGSTLRWPIDNAGDGDKRLYLNFWGSDTSDGGLCAGSYTSSSTFSKVKFAMTFQVEHSTTTATTTTETETSSTVTSTTTTVAATSTTKTPPPTTLTDNNANEEESRSESGPPASTSSSSTGTIVGVVVSLLFVASVVFGLFMMREKEQARQRQTTFEIPSMTHQCHHLLNMQQ